jgi:hypothetical protein
MLYNLSFDKDNLILVLETESYHNSQQLKSTGYKWIEYEKEEVDKMKAVGSNNPTGPLLLYCTATISN